jgi:hypothetical protein
MSTHTQHRPKPPTPSALKTLAKYDKIITAYKLRQMERLTAPMKFKCNPYKKVACGY